MGAKLPSLNLPASLPAPARKLFEQFPLAAGEDASDYRALLAGVLDALNPRDSIEAFWGKDLADLTWEIRRLRRLESALVEAPAAKAGASAQAHEERHAKTAAHFAIAAWASERGLDPREPTPELNAELARLEGEFLAPISSENESPVDALATAFLSRSADFDRIGRLSALAEGRRRAVLREIERYRVARSRAGPAKTFRPTLAAPGSE
jgi:hypothetical protein